MEYLLARGYREYEGRKQFQLAMKEISYSNSYKTIEYKKRIDRQVDGWMDG